MSYIFSVGSIPNFEGNTQRPFESWVHCCNTSGPFLVRWTYYGALVLVLIMGISKGHGFPHQQFFPRQNTFGDLKSVGPSTKIHKLGVYAMASSDQYVIL